MKKFRTILMAVLCLFLLSASFGPVQAADPPKPYVIYPQYGHMTTPAGPQWFGGYNLLWIDKAESLDLAKWKFEGMLISHAVQVKDANGKVLGLHVNVYPTAVGMLRIYQYGPDGKAIAPPTILNCDPIPWNPNPRR